MEVYKIFLETLILIILVLLFYYIVDGRSWYKSRFDKIDNQYEHISDWIDDINNTLKQWELSE